MAHVSHHARIRVVLGERGVSNLRQSPERGDDGGCQFGELAAVPPTGEQVDTEGRAGSAPALQVIETGMVSRCVRSRSAGNVLVPDKLEDDLAGSTSGMRGVRCGRSVPLRSRLSSYRELSG